MYAILGNVEFDLITYFDGLETQFGADYAEHALIGRKPRLQHVGDKLDEVKIDLVFHVSYCDPEAELVRLRNALSSHEALSLVLGNGDYKGRFVITDLTATGRHTDTAGTLLAVESQLSLREFTGDPARPAAPAVRSAGSSTLLPARSGLVKALPAAAQSPVSGLAKAVTAAKGALATAGRALAVAKAIQSLATRDPLTVLARLPGVTNTVGAALPGLSVAAAQLGQLNGLSSAAADAALAARYVTRVRDEVGSLANNLAGATPANLLSTLISANSAANRASIELQSATSPLARLTAQAVTRIV